MASMLITLETVNTTISDSEKRKKQASLKPITEQGVYDLVIKEIILKDSQKGEKMIEILSEKDEETRPIHDYYMLEGKGAEWGIKRIVKFVYDGFGERFPEIPDAEELLKYLSNFIGRKTQGIIVLEPSIMRKENGDTIQTMQPKILFFAKEGEKVVFNFLNRTKKVKSDLPFDMKPEAKEPANNFEPGKTNAPW